MNSDFRLSVEFIDHPKTKKLIKRLGHEAVTCLLRLWSWAARNKPDGNLSGYDYEDIELAAGWQGEEGIFVNTLTELHWLDKRGDDYLIHDWVEHNPWASEAERRSDEARFKAFKRHNPGIAKKLESQGVNSLSKDQYAFYNSADFMQQQCSGNAVARQRQCSQHANGNAPNPNPDPIPDPKEREREETPPAAATPAPEKEFAPEIVEFVRDFQQRAKALHNNMAPDVTDDLLKRSCLEVERTIRLDRFSLEQIKQACYWALDDEFWSKNMRSLAMMRNVGKNGLKKFQNVYADWDKARGRASPAPADDMDAHYFATNTGRVKSLVFSQPKGEFDARHE